MFQKAAWLCWAFHRMLFLICSARLKRDWEMSVGLRNKMHFYLFDPIIKVLSDSFIPILRFSALSFIWQICLRTHGAKRSASREGCPLWCVSWHSAGQCTHCWWVERDSWQYISSNSSPFKLVFDWILYCSYGYFVGFFAFDHLASRKVCYCFCHILLLGLSTYLI